MQRIRERRSGETDALIELWSASVRATHHFLSEAEIAFYQPQVRQALETLPAWVAEEDGRPAFMILAEDKLEALFVHPDFRGAGLGRTCLAFARERLGRDRALYVDVNEENGQAREFYRAMGFRRVGRSPVDGSGRPHPLVHLALEPGE